LLSIGKMYEKPKAPQYRATRMVNSLKKKEEQNLFVCLVE